MNSADPFTDLRHAAAELEWTALRQEQPKLAAALERIVAAGHPLPQLHSYVNRLFGSNPALAERLNLAAEYLLAAREEPIP